MIINTDNGHPERAFFQKFERFGLGQTNWAEILGCILAGQNIATREKNYAEMDFQKDKSFPNFRANFYPLFF